MQVAIRRQGGMTTITDTRTLTDRALAASADRILHAARSCDRPHLVDDDLAVAWQGDRGLYTNIAYPLAPEPDWGRVLERAEAVVPPGRPLALISAVAPPDLSARGWHLVGHPPFMARPAGPPDRAIPAELTVTEVVDSSLPAVLIASDLGRPVYERMGYVAVSRWTFWYRPS